MILLFPPTIFCHVPLLRFCISLFTHSTSDVEIYYVKTRLVCQVRYLWRCSIRVAVARFPELSYHLLTLLCTSTSPIVITINTTLYALPTPKRPYRNDSLNSAYTIDAAYGYGASR